MMRIRRKTEMKYEKPEIDVIFVRTEDILTLSNGNTGAGENIDPGEIF